MTGGTPAENGQLPGGLAEVPRDPDRTPADRGQLPYGLAPMSGPGFAPLPDGEPS